MARISEKSRKHCDGVQVVNNNKCKILIVKRGKATIASIAKEKN